MSNIKLERYTLVLRHDFVDGEDVHEIEKPLVVQYCVGRRYGGSSIIVNEMIDKLRDAVLNEEVYNKYYDTDRNPHWKGVQTGEHYVNL